MKIGLKIRYLILLWLMCITYISYSQSISVSNFKLLDTDLTANTAGTMELDQNGETAALIKVVTTQTGFTFDGGSMGIVKTKQTPGEVWVYIPRGAKKISIKHPQLGVLRDYYFPVAIEPAKTYEMVLVAGEVQTIVKQARTSQYVVFNLTPPDAVVELDGELLKTEAENPTIGLLICKDVDQTEVKWAFQGIQTPMGVAKYNNIAIKEIQEQN